MPQYELWGHTVDIEIPKDIFPSDEKQKELDEILGHPTHGFFEGTFGGKKLHYRKHLPANNAKPKALVIWQHGIHGESGFGMKCPTPDGKFRYTNFAMRVRTMTEQHGFAVYAHDQLGHGYSEGARFLIPSGKWQINRDDLIRFAKDVVCKEYPDVPLFLCGDSYGGCLVLHAGREFQDHPELVNNQFAGILLNAPAIIGDLPPAPVVALLRRLAVLTPTWTPFFMPHPVSSERIWKELEPREYYSNKNDGLSKGGKPFCLGTALGLLTALESVRADIIPGFTAPFSINHGTKDYAVLMEGSEFMMEHAKTPKEDAVLNKIPDGYHDMYSELNAEEILDLEIKWIQQQLDKQNK